MKKNVLRASSFAFFRHWPPALLTGLFYFLLVAAASAQVKKPVKPADAFVESIGVGTHLERGQYADRKTTVVNLLKSTGIRYVRSDRDGNIADAKAIADGAGIKLLLLYGDDYYSGDSNKNAAAVAAQIEAAGGAKNVWGIEGANETDIRGDGRRERLLDHQKVLWDAAHPKGIKVLSWSYFGTIKFGEDPNIEDRIDYGNLHPYHKFWGHDGDKGYPPLSSYFKTLREDWNGGKGYIPSIRSGLVPTKPLVATEVGFSTGGLASNDQTGMSEGASARYYMRALLGSFNVGFVKTFMYELLNGDEEGDGSGCTECRYGLARQDGTLKPSGAAVKNLISILSDPGNAGISTTALDYSLSGSGVCFKEFSATGDNGYDGIENCVNHLVFQKANGNYYVVLWQEGRSWDWNELKDAFPARKSVTVNFGRSFSTVKTFEPLTGGYSSPTSTPSGSLSSLTVQVPDHPLIIELGGGGTTTPVTTTSRQINVGGAAVSPFAADAGISGGSTFSSTNTIATSGTTNAAPAAVYQSGRWGTFTATVAGLGAGTSQKVRLHFAETSFTLAGQRKFNVSINGSTVLKDLDVVAEAGANKALVKEFTATANSSGQVVISFGPASVDNAFVNGIEVLSNSTSGSVADGVYTLTARHSGKRLDVYGLALYDTARVVQWSAASGLNQQWKLTHVGNGYYTLIAQHSGKALDVASSSTANGAKVQQYHPNPTAAQRWKIEATSDGYYKLTNQASGKVLEVYGGTGATANKARVTQWSYVGGTNQQWKLDLVSSSTAAKTSATNLTTLAAPSEAATLDAYPNPSLDGKATLRLTSKQAQRATVQVFNQQGQFVSLLTVPLREGQTEFRLPASLPPGTYYLKTRLDGQPQQFTLKVE
ncbi:RICIN domain-containing protein [Hymenobacter weizhouensis]|uniref:RICIN domain-containing protein n=1 Tax=Hymenobacter sp. YIM 151500-1 TaxID=2987689 RepID=UPI002226C334|nr:RICIN domain-containing protein [Hymenobacter sp. YIM 151500-1]UYZ63622.1 RICIN domain-containing protein [Hymenobacter sp. YIM 151500-1]